MAQSMTTRAVARDSAGQGALARLCKAFSDYRLYRATHDELARLNDRELSDLGIHRASIRDIAREGVYGA